MRRLLLLVACAAVAAIVVARGGAGGGDDRYRLAAEFDTGRGMVPGQLVKIAGAKVGTIDAVQLTARRTARMTLRIDPEFGPFHDDARCRILPEGFISESYVDCEPGTPGRPLLAQDASGLPTVPLRQTEVSVQLQQVIDTFNLPVSDRIRVILTELGVATAGRSDDLNALLRRANPALRQANQTLAIVDGQRREIERAVVATDRVLRTAAGRDRSLRRMVDRAAAVLETTARHQRPLEQSVARLPELLRSAESGLQDLDVAASSLTPTVRQLRRAAPELAAVQRTVPQFTGPARRALAGLGQVSRTGLRAVGPALGVLTTATRVAERVREPIERTRELAVSLRDAGAIENVLRVLYSLGNVVAAYDEVSHYITINLRVEVKCFVNPADPRCTQRNDVRTLDGQRPRLTDSVPPAVRYAPDGAAERTLARARRAAPTGRGAGTRGDGRDRSLAQRLPEDQRRQLSQMLDRILK